MTTSGEDRTRRLLIIGGGDKFELFQQLALIGLPGSLDVRFPIRTRSVESSGDGDVNVYLDDDHLKVTGLQSSDGFGEGWIISGTYPQFGPLGSPNHDSLWRQACAAMPFTGVYNTRTHEGYVDIELKLK